MGNENVVHILYEYYSIGKQDEIMNFMDESMDMEKVTPWEKDRRDMLSLIHSF